MFGFGKKKVTALEALMLLLDKEESKPNKSAILEGVEICYRDLLNGAVSRDEIAKNAVFSEPQSFPHSAYDAALIAAQSILVDRVNETDFFDIQLHSRVTLLSWIESKMPVSPIIALNFEERLYSSYKETLKIEPTKSITETTSEPSSTESAEMNTGERLLLGFDAIDDGCFDEAIEIANVVMAMDSNNSEAFYIRGSAWRGMDDNDRAISDLTEAIRINPNFSDAYFDRGDIWSDEGEFERAISDYNDAIRIYPTDVAFNNRGYAFLQKDLYAEAIRDFTSAIDIDPEYTFAYINRGISFKEKKDYDKAIQDFSKAIDINPNLHSAFYNRADAWRKKLDFDRAIADYSEAIRLCPEDETFHFFRGGAWHSLEEYDRAIDDFTNAIKIKPNYATAFAFRGVSRHCVGDLDTALADFSEAITLDKNYIFAFFARATVYEEKENLALALNDFRTVVRLAPADNDGKEAIKRIEEKIDLKIQSRNSR